MTQITIAMAKGRLAEQTMELMEAQGLTFGTADGCFLCRLCTQNCGLLFCLCGKN